jgi:6-pyruvoyltetrahydropterin/6-carboxytetrahydropterin synthase
MYSLSLKRRFVANHYLVGGDWGAENLPHAHAYQMEVGVESSALDAHGYVIDLVLLEKVVEETLAKFRDRTLNDRPEFVGLNPSLEHFARILAEAIDQGLAVTPIAGLEVRLWEHEAAFAAYRLRR